MTEVVERRYCFFTAAILTLAVLSAAAVHLYGTGARKFAAVSKIGTEPVTAVTVARPEDALRYWGPRYHGRTALVFDREWPRMDATTFYSSPLIRTYPFQVFNLAEKQEREFLAGSTFLYFATLRGTVRDIRAVLPEAALADVAQRASTAKNSRVEHGEVFSTHHGLPRTFSTLVELKSPDEPVLLFVSAGFFRVYEPDELLQRLVSLGVRTDSLVACFCAGDAVVSDREREKLRIFISLVGGAR